MGKGITFVAGYFISSFVLFFLLLFSLLSLVFSSDDLHRTMLTSRSQTQPQYQSVPEPNIATNTAVETADARVGALQKFFSDYDSPLLPHAEFIIKEADRNGIDYRLIPAIAMKESTLCHKIIKNTHNCWGYGIYGNKVTYFDSYEEGITTVTEGLAKRYVAIGLTDPYAIMTKYNPVSNGSWADTVTFVMERITTRL